MFNNPDSKWFQRLNYRFHRLRCWINRKRLHNTKNVTIISDNCMAGFLCSDLGLEFNTPTLNGAFSPSDYIKFLSNLDFYLSEPLSFSTDPERGCPIAQISDIRYRFTHYKSNIEAKAVWNYGKRHINYDNIFFIMTEKERCTLVDMQAFDELPFKNKVILTHKPYPNLKSAHHIRGFEQQEHCLVTSDFVLGQCFGKRYYNDFDFVKWLNQNTPNESH